MNIKSYENKKICCTISKKDLEARGINIRDFSHNTDATQRLLFIIIKQAKTTLNLNFEDTPIITEVIPIDTDNITLIISKK